MNVPEAIVMVGGMALIGNESITLNVEAIDAIVGPNNPFPIGACGERVFL